MPKLKNQQKGSTLVGTLVFALLVGISGVSLLSVVASGVNNEVDVLDDDRAFLAAETGALMGARWLRGVNVIPASGTLYPFSSSLSVNGLMVDVALSSSTDSTGAVWVEIISQAFDGGSLDQNTFRKRVTWRTKPGTFGQYSTFFDDVYSGHNNWGGFYRRTFEGRFHMNTYIEISSFSRPGSDNQVLFKNGLVTVASPFGEHYGTGAHHNNNYDFGVQLNFNDYNPVTQLDRIFLDEYRGSQEKIDIPVGLTSSDLQSNSARVLLPVSDDNGESYSSYRPTLEFKLVNGQPQAVYHYRQGGVLKEQTYSNPAGAVFISRNNLNVLGTLQGATTVATTYGKSIMPVGDITYSDYNQATGTVPSDSRNVLGLVSGKDIRFNNQWYKQWGGDGSGRLLNINGGNGTLDINASILAVESGNGWQATEYWDTDRQCNYSLKLTGNHILKAWRYPTATSSTGNPVGGCMGFIKNQHDSRLISSLQPPGFPSVKTSAGLWVLQFTDWAEGSLF